MELLERFELANLEKNLEAEQTLLWETQLYHQEALKSSGVFEKALQVAETVDPSAISDLTKIAVSSWEDLEDGDEKWEVFCVKLTTPEESVDGQRSATYRYIDVAAIYENEEEDFLDLRHEFTLSEAELVIELVAGLKEARDSGLLPNLSPEKSEILKPLIREQRPQSPLQYL
jgi:hypothetical protein